MTIVEAMKRLKIIEKRMETNTTNISKYSSKLSNELPTFDSNEIQKKEVKSLIQANEDLFHEYLKLKRNIELTNIRTIIEYADEKFSISDLLVIKRKLASTMIKTFEALSTKTAQSRVGRIPSSHTDVKVERLYDETFKNDSLRKWHDIYDNISGRLEVINATTQLIEE